MRRQLLAAAISAALVPCAALATDGYFAHGYGMKAKGRGGASTAMTTDSFGGAVNPATMVFSGDRLDVGVDWFRPDRSASRVGSAGGTGFLDGSAEGNETQDFLIPELGYNKMLNPNMSLGITIYGNGGMNTDYPGGQISAATSCGNFAGGFNQASGQAGPYNLLCGSGKLGVNLEQLIVAPTFAMKLNNSNSVGASLLLGYQRFKAEGLSAFYGYTTPAANGVPYASGNNLTDRGNDTSTGVGLRLGWMGKMSDSVTLGAAYATRMRMSKFDKYKDLFAEQGAFDLPENWNLGISFKATPQLTVALDYQQINYGAVKSISNSSRMPLDGVPPTMGVPNSLGCSSCRGFGWGDVSVVKLGVEYQYSPAFTMRAGYNRGSNPIQARDVTFNILAPGVVQDHYTLGFTYAVSKDSELTMAYMHATQKTVSGASLFNSWLMDGATDTIKMHEDSLGIGYSVKFK